MATKEMERKALDKIRKIIEELGEDSYIGMAMEGVLEDAEDNIINDFGNSYKARYEHEKQTTEKAVEKLYEKTEECIALKQELEAANEDAQAWKNKFNKKVEEFDAYQLKAYERVVSETKEIKIETVDGRDKFKQFAQLRFVNANGFRFINVVEKNGWTDSYKIDELKTLIIE